MSSQIRLVVFCICGMVFTGSVNTIAWKMMFTAESTNEDGEIAKFEKPWFGTLMAFLATAMVGAVDKCIRGCRAKSLDVDIEAAPEGPKDQIGVAGRSYWQKVLLVIPFTSIDLVSFALSGIGIMYTPASVWQMLRGTSVIFCALLSVVFLKRQLYAFNWIGVFLVSFGLVLVGLSSVLGDADQPQTRTTSELIFGLGVTVLSEVISAAVSVAEEWLLKDVALPAMQVVGWQGTWGTLMMLCVAYPLLGSIPGSDHGMVESPGDTLVMLGSSPYLQGLVIVYMISISFQNATSIVVTGVLSTVHRTMLDATRILVIWMFGLTVNYMDPTSPFGEAWTRYSILQCIGFVVLLFGQAIYGEVLKVPGLYYPANDAEPPKETE